MSLKIRRLGYALGAEVTNVDLTRELDDATIAEIRQAWLDHIVLCFPAQNLTPEQLQAFGARFGELDDNRIQPYARHPEFPNVIVHANNPVTINGKTAGGFVAESWHSDRSFSDRPMAASFLMSLALPDVGGNTMFANQYMAYDSLSPKMQELAGSLSSVYDYAIMNAYIKAKPEDKPGILALNPPAIHRVVTEHDETKKKALYVSDRIRYFLGMTEEESKPILRYLIEHATRYEFVYRHAWALHDLLMWDNRCSLHYAVQDYDHKQLRRMMKVAIVGPPREGSYHLDRSQLAAVG